MGTTRESERSATARRRTLLVALGCAALVAAISLTTGAAAAASGRDIVRQAEWPLTEAETDYYRMVLLPDGYPGVAWHSRVVAHPIYGVYLIRAFARQVRAGGDPEDVAALRAVVSAAVHRMKGFRGARVFWYGGRDAIPLNFIDHRAYSALTQAYYADALLRAADVLQDRSLRATAASVFDSLLIPASEGGVLSPGRFGPILQEAPTRVPSVILNGWLSALLAIKSYSQQAHVVGASQLLTSSAKELAWRLPRYDLPAVAGSAYSAMAAMTLRLRVPKTSRIRSISLLVDGARIPLRLTGPSRANDVVRILRCGSRTRHGIRVTCRNAEIKVPISVGGVAPRSTVRIVVSGPQGRPLRHGVVSRGVYRFVHTKRPQVIAWDHPQRLGRRGSVSVAALRVSLPEFKRLQPSTGFRFFGGHYVNVYHSIHIARLTALADIGGSPFIDYAARWRDAECQWSSNPVYSLIPRSDLVCHRQTFTSENAQRPAPAPPEPLRAELS